MSEPGEIVSRMRAEVNTNIFGPIVMIVRKYFNEDTPDEIIWMPAALAVMTITEDPLNGLVYKSAKIEWAGACAGDWDSSA